MPLARIITDSVDDSLELTIQLRARGFQVETVAPGTIPNTPADLEVRLEECESEDALSRASQTPTQDDLWVFVAPGALDERVRVIREIPIELMAGPEPRVVPPSRPIPSVAPVLPFLTPEDDPILAELVELKRSGEEQAQPAPAAERSLEKAEVVVLPMVGEPLAAANADGRVSLAESRRVRGSPVDREPESTANLRFWRIATVAAGLAIAALLLGANMSRQPNLPPAELLSATTTVQPASSPSPVHTPVVQPSKASAALALPPNPAKVATPTRQTPAAKAARAAPAKPRRRATSHADSIIAEDTVVFYDRKQGLPSGKGPEPGRKQSGRN